MIVRYSVLFVTLFTGPSAAILQQFQSPDPQVLPPGLTVSVETEKTAFRVGERISVGVRLANVGTQTVDVSPILEPQANWISFFVRDQRGREVKFIGKRFKMDWVLEPMQIEPGCFWGREFDLSKLFDVSRPGRYTVRGLYAPAGPTATGAFAALFTEQIQLTIKDVSSPAEHPPQSEQAVASSIITSLERIDGSSGSATLVGVRLANRGDTSVELEPRSDPAVTFDVTDEAGRRIEPVQRPAKQNLIRRPIRLAPGFFWGRAFDLGRTFNLKTGRYLVRARHDVAAPANVRSTVTEPVEIEIRQKS
jgi:hypothetical protein